MVDIRAEASLIPEVAGGYLHVVIREGLGADKRHEIKHARHSLETHFSARAKAYAFLFSKLPFHSDIMFLVLGDHAIQAASDSASAG